MTRSAKLKQSLLIGALTSSFGVFVSKLIGLLYYSPLSSFAGEANMSFYSIAYTYYDLLLKISSAGLPFAIASMVARYYAREDYKTVLLVKKLGTSLVMTLSFVVALVFVIFISPIAKQSMGGAAALPSDVENLKIVFYILVIAVIFVPFLSAMRGYYQGLKRLDLYASSQVLEQFVRVFCILFFGFLLVKVFSMDGIYAIYAAMAAAAIGAIVAIIFFIKETRDDDKHVRELAEKCENESALKKDILIEMLSLGIPYIVISFLGSASALVNTTFFMSTAASAGIDGEFAKLSLGILQANCNKLSSIPQVLTLGFSSGLVPYLTESFEKQDIRKLSKQISQIIDTVMFILVPVIFIFIFFAKDIYFIMYGNRNLDLGADLFRVSNLVAFTDTFAPILSSIMITLRMRKETIGILGLSFLAKFLSFFPLVTLFGPYGMIYSTIICSIVAIVLYLIVMVKHFDLILKTNLRRFGKIAISSLIMIIPGAAIRILANYLGFEYSSRIIDIGVMGVCGIVMILVYYLVTVYFKLPQVIFEIPRPSIKNLLRKFRS